VVKRVFAAGGKEERVRIGIGAEKRAEGKAKSEAEETRGGGLYGGGCVYVWPWMVLEEVGNVFV
jgi:hypothetical protein